MHLLVLFTRNESVREKVIRTGEPALRKMLVFYLSKIRERVFTKPNFDHRASLRIHPDWRHCYVITQFTAGISTLGWLLVDDETPTQIEIRNIATVMIQRKNYRSWKIRRLREGPGGARWRSS